MNNQDFDISSLIKEARPLYRARKKREAFTKLTLLMCLPMFALVGMYNIYLEGTDLYLSLAKNNLQTELIQDQFGLYR